MQNVSLRAEEGGVPISLLQILCHVLIDGGVPAVAPRGAGAGTCRAATAVTVAAEHHSAPVSQRVADLEPELPVGYLLHALGTLHQAQVEEPEAEVPRKADQDDEEEDGPPAEALRHQIADGVVAHDEHQGTRQRLLRVVEDADYQVVLIVVTEKQDVSLSTPVATFTLVWVSTQESQHDPRSYKIQLSSARGKKYMIILPSAYCSRISS